MEFTSGHFIIVNLCNEIRRNISASASRTHAYASF